jgi:uroporphyrinogen-III synthase
MTHKPRPLRLLNTRPREQASVFSDALRRLGMTSIELPTLAIVPTPLDWIDALPPLSSIDCAVFISPNAVMHFFNGVDATQWPPNIQTIAMGTGTANALMDRGITVHHLPSTANSEHLLMLDILKPVKHQTMLLIKGHGGRDLIEHTLNERGATVFAAEVYRRELPIIDNNFVHALWHHDEVDMILITSHEAMQNLFTIFGPAARAWLCSKPFLMLSSRLATHASAYGVKTIITSDYDTLLITLKRIMNER